MKVLELFAGERSIGKAFERRGHYVFSVEWDKIHPDISWYTDIGDITVFDIFDRFGEPDVIWASPDCTSYSVAALSTHIYHTWDGELEPESEYARFCDRVNVHVLRLIAELSPKFWFIENPRGGLRKMRFMSDLPRYTTTYCQYHDNRMKPTDIWTNHPNPQLKEPCKNGSSCHIPAPRGSKTGTQGINGSANRALIPEALCDHIVTICESHFEQGGVYV